MRINLSYLFLPIILLYSPFLKSNDHEIPNLVGTWLGINKTISDQRGFRTWEKKVEILEQKDRRFKGTFSYTDGTKNFFGVIHPDNKNVFFRLNQEK